MLSSFFIVVTYLPLIATSTANANADDFQVYKGCVDYPWSATLSKTKQVTTILGLFDVQNITNCRDLEQHPGLCDYFGDTLFGDSLMYPNEACCVCDGGMKLEDEEYICFDQPGWYDRFDYNCSYYASDPPKTNKWALNQRMCLDSLDDPSGEGCCVCNGGVIMPQENFTTFADGVASTSPPTASPSTTFTKNRFDGCKDNLAWKDTFTASGCSWYAKTYESDPSLLPENGDDVDLSSNRCKYYGDKGYNKGYSATDACCVCNTTEMTGSLQGGININAVITKEIPIEDIPNRKVAPYDTCKDVETWGVIDFTCDNLVENNGVYDFHCERYGLVPGKYGLTANDMCCLCGGGYSGPNLSRTFRVNYTYYKTDSYANIPYELYTNSTDVDSVGKAGSIPRFFDFAAMYGGWGYYSQEISAISQMEYPNSEINQCIFDVTSNFLDFCIGTFWDVPSSIIGPYPKKTKSLVTSKFFMIVTVEKFTFLDLIITPFQPFTGYAWLGIIVTVCFMVCAMNIIGDKTDEPKTKQSMVTTYFYYVTTSFTGGSVARESESPSKSEKVVTIGFAIFSLLILTAYTATSAVALLVNNKVKFENLADISSHTGVSLCVDADLMSYFLQEHRETSNILKSFTGSPIEMIKTLFHEDDSPEKCDALVMSEAAYDGVERNTTEYCTNTVILLDEEVMEVDNVIYFSPSLETDADDLIESFNLMIDANFYLDLLNEFNANFTREKPNKCDIKHGEDPSGDSFQLTFLQVMVPLLYSVLCTTIGLILYFFKRSNRAKINKMLNLELSTEQKDSLLSEELSGKEATDLIELCKSLHISNTDILVGIDMLPDKSQLVKLCFNKLASSYTRNREEIEESLTLSELYVLLEFCNGSKEMSTETGESCHLLSVDGLNETDDKIASTLVAELMKSPKSRLLALNCARTKANAHAKDNDFDINTLLIGSV